MVGLLVASILLFTNMGTMAASQTDAGALVKLKAGTCHFKLLASDGIKPLTGSLLTLSSIKDGKNIAEAVADKTGKCNLDISVGRYIISVNKRELAILETSEESKISECRIVVPAEAMQVGGQAKEGAAATTGKKGSVLLLMKPVIVGGVVVLTGAGGYLVYDNNKSDNNDDTRPPAASQ